MRIFIHLRVILSRSLLAFTLISFFSVADTAQDYEKALAAFNQEEFRASYIHLKNALSQSPDHLPSKLLMGRILLIDDHADAAITEFDEVIDQGADLNLVIIPLANAYLIQRRYQDIINLATPRNASNSLKLDLLLIKAVAHMQLKQYERALAVYQQAHYQFGDNVKILNGLAQLSLIDKDLPKAREWANKARSLDSKNPQTILLSGLIFQAEAQSSLAKNEFILAYQYSAKDPAIMRALANSYAQDGELQKAEALIAEIELQSPGDLQTQLLKARLLALAEKNIEADAVLNQLSQTLSTISEEDKQRSSWLSLVAGITAHMNENYTVSVREISRYLQNSEPSAELVAILAEGYVRTDNNKLAIQTLERYESLILKNIQVSSLLCDLYLVSNKLFKCDSLVQNLLRTHGELPSLLLLEAKLLAQRNRPAEALKILTSPKIDGNSAEILLLHTGLLVQLGRFDDALQYAKKLLILAPDNIAYLNLNVDLLIRFNELSQADDLLKKVLLKDPDNISGLINDSRIKFSRGERDVALTTIQKVVDQDPTNITALVLSAQIMVKQEKYDEATEILLKAKVLDLNKPAPRELLVSIYKQQDRPDLALSEIDQLLKLDRLNSAYLLDKAKIQIAMGNYSDAKNQLAILYSQWQTEPEKLIQLSQLQVSSGDYAGAASSLMRAQEEAPAYLLAKLEYAKLLLQQNDLAQAKMYMAELNKTYPKEANVALLTGQYEKAMGNTEKSYIAFKKALALSPNFTAPLVELYQLAIQNIHANDTQKLLRDSLNTANDSNFRRHLLADLYFIQKDYSQAAVEYEQLIGIAELPNKANIYNNLANILSHSDKQKALLYAEQAVLLNSNSSAILDTKGWLLTLNENPQEGLNILRQAFTLKSNDPSIRYHLAYTLHKLGRLDEARMEVSEALASDKNFDERNDAKQLLDSM